MVICVKTPRHFSILFPPLPLPTFAHTRTYYKLKTLNYELSLPEKSWLLVPFVPFVPSAPKDPKASCDPTEPAEPAEPTEPTDSTDSMTIILASIQIIIKILARSALISTPQEWQYRCCFSCYRVVPVVWQNPFHQFHISKFLRKQALRHSKVQLCEIIKTSNANIVH